jgi:hypothetical protein
MLNSIGAAADRLLSRVVPKAAAGACCPPDPSYETCFCSGKNRYAQRCTSDCACRTHCDPTCYLMGTC